MIEPFVSIVINNYNYARFLPGAIDSALAQDYPRCEVIVVDDGSQDESRPLIATYGDRIHPVLKENGGQASAFNAGFAASRGEIVIFLDADDLLAPAAARQVAAAFTRQPQTARLQYRMAVIDAAGQPTGETKPAAHVPALEGEIQPQVLHFPFDLAWLPTSGNAFAARVLRRIMPVPAEYGRINADYYLVHVSALYGPVAFLDQVLASYRVHGGNNFEKTAAALDLDHLRTTIHYDELTHRWIRQRARAAGLDRRFTIPPANQSVSTAASRLVSLKLAPQQHPLPGDRLIQVVALGVRSAAARTDTSLPARLIFAAWFVITGLAPRPLARWLADRFFFPARRQAVTRLLGRLHARRAPGAPNLTARAGSRPQPERPAVEEEG